MKIDLLRCGRGAGAPLLSGVAAATLLMGTPMAAKAADDAMRKKLPEKEEARVVDNTKAGLGATQAHVFEHVSCKGDAREIRIVVNNVKKNAGLISADLFPNKQEGFLSGRGRISQVKFAARSPQTKFCIRAPEDGEYAIAVYHDKNANGNFDKTGLGLPAEPWGLSMNPRVRFAPPPVEKTVFAVEEDGVSVSIKLRN